MSFTPSKHKDEIARLIEEMQSHIKYKSKRTFTVRSTKDEWAGKIATNTFIDYDEDLYDYATLKLAEFLFPNRDLHKVTMKYERDNDIIDYSEDIYFK